MPGLSAIYGLKWHDVLVMPRSELNEYLEQLRDWARVLSSGTVDMKE